ncbi:RpiB/LacA/LacB family sugar-phosphate isomerase [Patescibacteria group bacterium]|nr:RpiB/LacA/LacB family sugar-phosphate isomerase [Patescibacteria group bacterium]
MLVNRTIYVATDHAGFLHKEAVRDWLVAEGCTVLDVGAPMLDEGDDFPDYISVAANAVSQTPETAAAIIFGGSGQGEAMVANRFSGVRATVYYGGEESIIKLSREHNDANVLSIGARFVSIDEAKKVIWDWLHLPKGTDPKYHRRNLKIDTR